MADDDDPIVQPPDATRIQETRIEDTRIQPPRPVPPLSEQEADVNVVHEEERVRVLADGSVVRETDRIEQRSRFRDLLPWLLIALLGVILIAGIVIWYVTKSDSKSVPTVVGQRVDAAVNRMQADGFKVQIARQSSSRAPGIVFGQNPAGGTSVNKGSTVNLLVSSGRSRKTVPNAVGRSQAAGRSALVQAGFAVTTAEVPSDQPVGTIVAQDPAAGTRVAPGTKVRINVSKGLANVTVPSEVGSTVTDAKAALVAKGFKPAVALVSSNEAADTVVAQNPAGGTAPKGSTVQLSVSQGPSTATSTTATVPTTPGTTTVTTPGATTTSTVTTPGATTTSTVTTPGATTNP
jgi:beta-lactam-binding protein with PASTA domain